MRSKATAGLQQLQERRILYKPLADPIFSKGVTPLEYPILSYRPAVERCAFRKVIRSAGVDGRWAGCKKSPGSPQRRRGTKPNMSKLSEYNRKRELTRC
jgi:hypothetical protein